MIIRSIEVSLLWGEDQRCSLVVSDDGVGLPIGVDVFQSWTLGLSGN